MLAHLQCPHL